MIDVSQRIIEILRVLVSKPDALNTPDSLAELFTVGMCQIAREVKNAAVMVCEDRRQEWARGMISSRHDISRQEAEACAKEIKKSIHVCEQAVINEVINNDHAQR